MKIHREGSAFGGEQLSRQQEGTEQLSVDDVYGNYTERPALKGSLHDFCYVRLGSQS